MTKQQIERQSKTLLQHGLTSNGSLDAKLTKTVFSAVAQSNWPQKRMLLRQMLRDVARIERRQTAIITSAQPLNDEQKQDIQRTVTRSHPLVTGTVWRQDEQLLAGLTMQVGDVWYDMSIKNRLVQVREHLG